MRFGRYGVSDQNYYRYCNKYRGLKVDHPKQMKDVERENARVMRRNGRPCKFSVLLVGKPKALEILTTFLKKENSR
jgi:hypothetical protein